MMNRAPEEATESCLPAQPEGRELQPWRRWLTTIDEDLVDRFKQGESVDRLVYGRAQAMDRLIIALWRQFVPFSDSLALIAVGGYGRGELHPHSDIDLMVLLPFDRGEQLEQAVSAFLTFLWDLKLDVGHSVRTVDECLKLAGQDVTVTTNLMEMRLLDGDRALFDHLKNEVTPDKIWPADEFFKAKYQEQLARHARFNDTAYNLEPNIKKSPGGLRDIQMVVWMASRYSSATTLEDLVTTGFLDHAEYADLHSGRNLLWRVRFGLHVLAGRNEDRLLFDFQRDLAELFGYRDSHHENLAVEQLMQRYFRTVMRLGQLNEYLVQALEEQILHQDDSVHPEALGDDFERVNHKLRARRDDIFVRRPVLLLEAFLLIQTRPDVTGLDASTIRLMMRSLDLIGDEFRSDPAVKQTFMRILRGGGNIPKLLTLMHRYGVLGRYMPAFAQITGRMQYDLFHVYTVDQHTLFVMRQMHGFSSEANDKKYPLAATIFRNLPKPELLYLAGFFHDIAKGRGGDHSQLGEQDAQSFCESHGLSDSDTTLIKWLVRYHLLMSVTAQRQDISDPSVVNRFAQLVGNQDYLDYLYLLTVADITGTSPKLWTHWKARLLAELYQLTRQALQRGLENPMERQDWARDSQAEALSLLAETGVDEAGVRDIWSGIPDEYFLRHSADQIAWQTGLLLGRDHASPVLVGVRQRTVRATTEVFVFAPNLDGCFATIIACLTRLSLNIIDARIFNTHDGFVMDTFQVLDQSGGMVDEQRSERIRSLLSEQLNREPLVVPELNRQLPRRLQHFFREPKIAFGRAIEDQRTLFELVCSDRPGLLAIVARVLLQQKVRIHGAKVATFGDRVEDYFLISDRENQPLSAEAKEQLEHAIRTALSEGMPEPVGHGLGQSQAG